MQNINDGGPAFPFNDADECGRGMSLRDYFAAHLVSGVQHLGLSNHNDDILAARAYEVADAMLRARQQTEPQSPAEVQAEHLATFGDGK